MNLALQPPRGLALGSAHHTRTEDGGVVSVVFDAARVISGPADE